METPFPEFEHYPDARAIDALIADLWAQAEATPCSAELLDPREIITPVTMAHMAGFRFVRFEPTGLDPFYGFWQPAAAQPAPLLIHTPGYGAEFQMHPDLVAQGYNVLHVNPLGYNTPEGPDTAKQKGGDWPVFADTIFEGFDTGYGPWLVDVMVAIRWAQGLPSVLPDRVAFFGTSQGGGASLLLGSIYRDHGARCVAADEPWMVHFPQCCALEADWSAGLREAIAAFEEPSVHWRRLGMVDALSHAHRLKMPVLLTAGGADRTCPPETIQTLYERLPATKSITYLEARGHGYTQQFPYLAAAWFRMYL